MTWQPIDTAPKDGTVVLGWSKLLIHVGTYMWRESSYVPETGWVLACEGAVAIESADDSGYYYCDPEPLSHWMPLPAPPETSMNTEERSE